jgi:ribosomal protein S18 acetylase RimI-like enzyme
MLVTIRDADEGDVAVLAVLSEGVQELHAGALPEFFKKPERGAVVDLFQSRLRRSDVRAWIAEVDGMPAGYAVATIRERPENALCRPRRVFEVDEIAVSVAHRRQGVARALIERVLTQARSEGIREVELTSWSFNVEAHAAFTALGFAARVIRFGRDVD